MGADRDLAGAAWVGLTAGPGAAGAPVFPPGVPGASWDLQESETWLNSSLASPGWLSSAGSVGREQPWLQPSERKQQQISLSCFTVLAPKPSFILSDLAGVF